jgi:hypothetical protein
MSELSPNATRADVVKPGPMAGPVTAERPYVIAAMQTDAELERLLSRIAQLEDRLDPVLTPTPPTSDAIDTAAPLELPDTSVNRVILDCAQRIAEATRRIDSVMDRIGI